MQIENMTTQLRRLLLLHMKFIAGKDYYHTYQFYMKYFYVLNDFDMEIMKI
jgi:hypothetical protein